VGHGYPARQCRQCVVDTVNKGLGTV
jgi:hypothetical protein